MKKFFILAAAAIMAATGARAQYEEGMFTCQPRIGATLSTLTDYDNAKTKTNICYGLELEHYLTDNFSLAGSLLFTNQGAKFKSDIDYEMNLYYTTIPITANYYVLPGLAVKAGVQPAYRVKARIEEGGEKIDFDRALQAIFQNEEIKMNKFDFSIPVGLSYEFKGFTLDMRYNFGVTKLFSGTDNSIHNRVLAMTLGYKFKWN
jgi:hypothetical protein